MALNREFIGRKYPAADQFEVGREQIRQFAVAIGDPNPFYLDRAVARAAGHPDVLAPPTFLTTIGLRFREAGPMEDPALGLNYSMVVHGEQAFELHRPVYAGDMLSMVNTVTAIRDAGRNELMTTEITVTDGNGEPVATLVSTLVSRGTAAGKDA
jgi:acyl dehydratase